MSKNNNNGRKYADWIGKTVEIADSITEFPYIAFEAMLNRKAPPRLPGHPLSPSCHWLYFLPRDLQGDLAQDGHAKKGDFLPPVDLPRRMWAGGRLSFHGALEIGAQATRKSTITDISEKSGRSGDLVFVTVRHEISAGGPILITEEHDIVYRQAAQPGAAAPKAIPAPLEADWREEIKADPVMLFRYSALTFNGHRIHYDRDYCLNEEGYGGLIVHGPLQGTLLMDLCARKFPDRKLKRFDFRNLSPLFDINPFSICGNQIDDHHWKLWVAGPDNATALQAEAEFE